MALPGTQRNPFDQSLSSADSPTFATVTVTSLAAAQPLKLTPTAFASLPTGVEGMVASVSDSNTVVWGATIAGGSTNKVLAYFNGTNWTVAGK